jgi:predicted RNA-binding Zn ribbon-like protein
MERISSTHDLEGKQLCLDFANTAQWHASAHPIEQLNSYSDLVSWARKKRLLTSQEAKRLSGESVARPVEAESVLQRAIELREAIYRVFSAVARKRLAEATDIDTINAALSDALSRLQVARKKGSFTWRWDEDEATFDRILWPVARSTAELLTSELLPRVGQCADDRGCGYLFLDLSKNRTRRWCDMKDCGNRAKAQRHYRRKRKFNKIT